MIKLFDKKSTLSFKNFEGKGAFEILEGLFQCPPWNAKSFFNKNDFILTYALLGRSRRFCFSFWLATAPRGQRASDLLGGLS